MLESRNNLIIFIMETQLTSLEIKDNSFSRQFETVYNGKLMTIEYSFQEKKIFLTRMNLPEGFDNEEFCNDFIVSILNIAYERNLKVVPILPRIATFFKKNKMYHDLLPPGIRL